MIRSLFPNKAAIVASIILLCQAVVYYGRVWTEIIVSTPLWSQFPASFNGWERVEDSEIDDATMAKLRPDDYLNRTYRRGESSTSHVFVGYFKTRRSGFAPHSPEACLPGAGWKTTSVSEVSVGREQKWKANRMLVERGGTTLVVLYWYLQGREPVTSEVEAQFRSLPGLLLHGRTDNALVRTITEVGPGGVKEADAVVQEFAASVGGLVLKHLP